MGRRSILNLPDPAPPYRVDEAPPCQRKGKKFETIAQARKEDLTRANLIRKTCRDPDVPFDRQAALLLADQLERSGLREADGQTMASMIYVGRNRLRIGGALWKLVDGR